MEGEGQSYRTMDEGESSDVFISKASPVLKLVVDQAHHKPEEQLNKGEKLEEKKAS